MVFTVPTDKIVPISDHFSELFYLIRLQVIFFTIFSLFWAFLVDQVMLTWLNNLPLGQSSLDLAIYGPYDWIEIQWSMVFLLSAISVMPFLSISLQKFMNPGLLPREKNWFSILLLFNLFMIPIILITVWVFLLPNFISSFVALGSLEGVGNHYDASAIFKLTLGLSWIFIVLSLTTISLSLARLLGLFDTPESNLRFKIISFSGSIMIITLPNEYDGIRILIAIIVIYLSDIISRTLPKSPLGLRLFSVNDIVSETGVHNRFAIVDCSCEGACPTFPSNFTLPGVALPSCKAICLNTEEQDSLADMVFMHNISKIIISGCDGSPVPNNLQKALEVNNCTIHGLEWLDSKYSHDESWKLNSLKDSVS